MTEFEWRMKRVRKALFVPFEWVGIVCVLALIVPLPRRGLFGVCDVLSRAMYLLDSRGKRRSLENLRIVLGRKTDLSTVRSFDPDRAAYDPTPGEARIIRRSYRNMCRTVGYAFWTCVRAHKRCADTGLMDADCRKFLAEHRPAITVSGHIGCWEILSQLAFLEGHPMMSVAKRIGMGGITSLLLRARRSIGQEIVPADGAFKPLMQGLKDGRSLGLLVDQRVSPRDGGVWIRFCGVPMAVSAAPAFFAAKGNAPIVVAWSHPLKDGRYRCEFVDAISAAAARDIWRTTQRIADGLAQVIRRHPSCWVLNYNLFCEMPKAKDLETLNRRIQEAANG